MKLMSFALTWPLILAESKTVTRRLESWDDLEPGTLLQPIQKGQGLKKGERVVRGPKPICVVDVRPEPLRRLIEDPLYGRAEVDKEGFPDKSILWFVTRFMTTHKGCTLDSRPNRIEFGYVEKTESQDE